MRRKWSSKVRGPLFSILSSLSSPLSFDVPFHSDLPLSFVLFPPLAVICDFGLARVTTAATTLENMKFKEIGGFSPRYAAPEVLASGRLLVANDAETDKKSDVYSFAIVLWEMLTRQIPWDGLTKEQIESNVRSGLRVRISIFPVFR